MGKTSRKMKEKCLFDHEKVVTDGQYKDFDGYKQYCVQNFFTRMIKLKTQT